MAEEPNPDLLSTNLSLPTPRDWAVRYGGCPWLGGSIEDQVQRLREFLKKLQETDGSYNTEIASPDGSVRTVGWYSRNLGSSGILASNGEGHVKISETAAQWLSTADDRLLAGLIHSRIRLFGEILQILRDRPGITHEELYKEASAKYQLDWKTLDPVRRRVGWLRSFKYVELTFNRTLHLTKRGEDVLPLLKIVQPADVSRELDPQATSNITLPAAIAQEASEMNDEKLSERKNAFGYIPRSNVRDIYESIKHLCLLFDPETTKEEFVSRCSADFGVKDSSGISALYALRSMGLVEQVSLNGYRLTINAREWINSEERWGLLAIAHTKIFVVGELIPYMKEVIRVPTLQKTINRAYGSQLSLSEIRSRIHLLVACSAIEQLAPGQFRATQDGLALAQQMSLLSEPEVPNQPSTVVEETTASGVLRQELTEAATDSKNPERFEKAIQQCFEALGYHAEHLGGPGKTDVLVHYTDGPGKTQRFIVDAKSSASGTVTDNMVQFPALKDHVTKHKAKFAVLVGPTFVGRVVSWADENNIVLLDLARLKLLLDNQDRIPAPLDVVTDFLSGKEDGWSALETAWGQQQRSVELLIEVIDCLRREFNNPDGETEGALSAEQIYFLLRDVVEPRPTQASIKPLLDLISSPLIQGTHAVGKGWVFPDPPKLISQRLRTIANRIDALSEAESSS